MYNALNRTDASFVIVALVLKMFITRLVYSSIFHDKSFFKISFDKGHRDPSCCDHI